MNIKDLQKTKADLEKVMINHPTSFDALVVAIAIYDLNITLTERLDKFLEKTEKSVFEHVFGKR